MNTVILMGRLTKDPEVRYSQSDTPIAVARYTLAVNNHHTRNAEYNTDFINIVAFAKQGEYVEKYFKKGNRVVVSGRIHQDTWEDADHTKHTRFEVVAQEQHFADTARVSKAKSEEKTTEGQIAITDVVE